MVWLFFKAVGKHWLTLMGCAAFTFLGMWVVYADKDNAWTIRAMFATAAMCLFSACFLAWREEHERRIYLEIEASKASAMPIPQTAPIPVVATASPVTTQIANPTIDASQKVEIHNYPPPAPVPLVEKSPTPTLNRAKPNIKYINHNVVELGLIEGPLEYFVLCSEDTLPGTNLKAFIASFRNERIAGIAVSDWRDVSAQIIYRTKYDQEIANIGAAGWVGTTKDYVSFDGGHTLSVIVAIRRGDGKWAAYSPSEMGTVLLTNEIEKAEVILHDSKGFSLEPKKFVVDFKLGMIAEP